MPTDTSNELLQLSEATPEALVQPPKRKTRRIHGTSKKAKAFQAKSRAMKARVMSPEWKAKFQAGRARHRAELKARTGSANYPGQSRDGIPDGYTREAVIRARRVFRTQAERIVGYLMSTNEDLNKTLTDDDAAKEALTTAVSIMRGKGLEKTSDRLAAAKMVLDFTKQKPATKNDVTVRNAEAFLDEVAAAEEKQSADSDSSGQPEGSPDQGA